MARVCGLRRGEGPRATPDIVDAVTYGENVAGVVRMKASKVLTAKGATLELTGLRTLSGLRSLARCGVPARGDDDEGQASAVSVVRLGEGEAAAASQRVCDFPPLLSQQRPQRRWAAQPRRTTQATATVTRSVNVSASLDGFCLSRSCTTT